MGVVAPPCADHPAKMTALLYWLQVWIPIVTQIRVIIIAAMPSAAPGPDSDERYSVPVTSSRAETLPVTHGQTRIIRVLRRINRPESDFGWVAADSLPVAGPT